MISRFAAAAVIVLAFVLFLAWPGTGNRQVGIVLADVVQHIQQARTVTYSVIEETERQPAKTMKVFIVEPDRIRTETTVSRGLDGQSDTMVNVIDLREGKSLNLTSSIKQAHLVDFAGTALDSCLKRASLDSWATLRTVRDFSKVNAVSLGQQVVAGQRSVGFRLDDPAQKETTTIWADAQTGRPIRVERTKTYKPYEVADGPSEVWVTTKQVITDIVFDAYLDGALFSLTPPEGYSFKTVMPTTVGVNADVSEQDLVAGLLIIAELNDGDFSAGFDTAAMMRLVNEGQNNTARKAMDLQRKVAMLARMHAYEQKLRTQGVICQDVGEGVELGDATKAVCFIGRQDGASVRVVFGDLSVREIPAGSDELKMIVREHQQRARRLERERGWLGIEPPDGDESPDRNGYSVDKVMPGSPAEKAGLRGGDVIRGYNTKSVRVIAELENLLRVSKAGDKVALTVQREGQTLTLDVVLGQQPDRPRDQGPTSD